MDDTARMARCLKITDPRALTLAYKLPLTKQECEWGLLMGKSLSPRTSGSHLGRLSAQGHEAEAGGSFAGRSWVAGGVLRVSSRWRPGRVLNTPHRARPWVGAHDLASSGPDVRRAEAGPPRPPSGKAGLLLWPRRGGVASWPSLRRWAGGCRKVREPAALPPSPRGALSGLHPGCRWGLYP